MNNLSARFTPPPCRLFIDGSWVKPDGDAREEVINPYNEEVLGEAPVGSKSQAEAALASARRAFDHGPWRTMKAVARQQHLEALYQALVQRESRIKETLTAELGSIVPLTNGLNYGLPMAYARFVVDNTTRDPITSLTPEVSLNEDGSSTLISTVAVREPIGVCAVITAFNGPFLFSVLKTFPALATGNTVVLKPSPFTPYTALIFGEAVEAAGLPPGVLNVVTGGPEVGACLTQDSRVDLVSFTGSESVGAAIQAQSAPTLKRLVLELGGKSALIVRRDADLQASTTFANASLTMNSGQGCGITTRLLVDNAVRGEFVRLLASKMRGVKMGNPADPTVTMGPLIRESQRVRTERYVQLAIKDGAELITGGHRPEDMDRGFWYEPTLFEGVSNAWRVAREEIFGPVAVVIGFNSDEEAVAIANDSDYGLAGGIFSRDVGRAYQIGLLIRTGRFWINGGARSVSAGFGGIKRSGYGREWGLEGIDAYTYMKSITFRGA
jgi:aldehyde dehydrogenase (NAD+)